MDAGFPADSRYAAIGTDVHTEPSGRQIVYLRRRFLPPAGDGTVLARHAVRGGDRLDNVTALYLDDPQQFWRVCDANAAMNPADLLEPGRLLVIQLPEEA